MEAYRFRTTGDNALKSPVASQASRVSDTGVATGIAEPQQARRRSGDFADVKGDGRITAAIAKRASVVRRQ